MVQHRMNFYTNCMYALTWHIKHAGNKVWSESNGRAFEKWNEICIQNNVYYS